MWQLGHFYYSECIVESSQLHGQSQKSVSIPLLIQHSLALMIDFQSAFHGPYIVSMGWHLWNQTQAEVLVTIHFQVGSQRRADSQICQQVTTFLGPPLLYQVTVWITYFCNPVQCSFTSFSWLINMGWWLIVCCFLLEVNNNNCQSLTLINASHCSKCLIKEILTTTLCCRYSYYFSLKDE